ncbi:hypothetical protein [Bordetella petrii]|uniref:Uncharacterized protein n=1 Tax=Bordetella petrii (strain ATCC BAA-461 / DSM 12804 / CCUG 43448 / CIP 107267 / Se-1111R) TaxID=340100 RepID=A9I2C0_BORPD|nr:hypothetical protein [Bordetella petrii]CAP40955.1 hypothetical protein Bpet0623 [Bordetella petrii]
MNKTARQNVPSEHADDRWPKAPTHADKGTGVMPMPDEAPDVAGRARRGRAIAEPGDPGVITPEDDVLDTSHLHRHDR